MSARRPLALALVLSAAEENSRAVKQRAVSID
jgi:hypothetical protein